MPIVPKNPRKRAAWWTVVVFFVALAGCFAPGLAGVDMMKVGFGLVVLSGLVALTSFFVAVSFFRSAARLGQILAGQGLLASWTYPPEVWRRFVQVEKGISTEESRGLFKLVFVITVVLGLGFMLIVRDRASVIVFGVLMGLMAVLWALSTFGPMAHARHYLRTNTPVLISERGIYIAGDFHDFRLLNSRLVGASLVQAEELTLLAVEYSYPTARGSQGGTVRVPVPAGAEDEAQRVADRLNELAGGAARTSLPSNG